MKRGDGNTKRHISQLTLEYHDGEKWIKYQDGAAIETGQTPATTKDEQLHIPLVPFKAKKVEVSVPRSGRGESPCDIKFDLVLVKNKKEETAKSGVSSDSDGDGKYAIMELDATTK